jgi:hypothetical protein
MLHSAPVTSPQANPQHSTMRRSRGCRVPRQ